MFYRFSETTGVWACLRILNRPRVNNRAFLRDSIWAEKSQTYKNNKKITYLDRA